MAADVRANLVVENERWYGMWIDRWTWTDRCCNNFEAGGGRRLRASDGRARGMKAAMNESINQSLCAV